MGTLLLLVDLEDTLLRGCELRTKVAQKEGQRHPSEEAALNVQGSFTCYVVGAAC